MSKLDSYGKIAINYEYLKMFHACYKIHKLIQTKEIKF
jgi:hypothetical protein